MTETQRTIASVMTEKRSGAISTILVHGEKAKDILKNIFTPASQKYDDFTTGNILLGKIMAQSQPVDQVTIGCEGHRTFAINCHGNPLIIEKIMELLADYGAEPVSAEKMTIMLHAELADVTTIDLEIKLTIPKCKTLRGTKILLKNSLPEQIKQWRENLDSLSIAQINKQAKAILEQSQPANLLIYGATIILTGPPNSGKSTLLNALAGGQKAIVTDIAGTTRDWVSADCHLGPLTATIIDTAGLDKTLAQAATDSLEKTAQNRTLQKLRDADMVLLVIDSSKSDSFESNIPTMVQSEKLLPVLNKSDLPQIFNESQLPQELTAPVRLSAKITAGLDRLIKAIIKKLGVDDIDPKQAIVFTDRQKALLEKLEAARTKQSCFDAIERLLKGDLSV